MQNILTTFLEIAIVLGLVAANGFFVAAEFALVKVRTSQLQPLAKQGGWRVKLAIQATRHLDVALEALREAWRERRVTMAELEHYARMGRVSRVMNPYLASLT